MFQPNKATVERFARSKQQALVPQGDVGAAQAAIRACTAIVRLCLAYSTGYGATMIDSRLFILPGFVLLAACAHAPRPSVELNAESECPQHLKVDQRLTLSLPGNPSTGYRWTLKNSAGAVLDRLGPEVYSTAEDTGIVGSVGVSTWQFKAATPGTGMLVLHYQQPWAADAPPAETFDCKIIVD